MGKSKEDLKADRAERDVKPGLMDKISRFREYFVLSRAELRKVSWPTWKETRNTSIVVFAVMVFMALFLGIVDYLLAAGVRLILS